MIKGRGFVPFKGEFIEIREIIGIDKDFIFFNPYDNGKNFLIQKSEFIFILDENTNQLVQLDQIKGDFEIITNKQTYNKKRFNEEFIQNYLIALQRQNQGGVNEIRN